MDENAENEEKKTDEQVIVIKDFKKPSRMFPQTPESLKDDNIPTSPLISPKNKKKNNKSQRRNRHRPTRLAIMFGQLQMFLPTFVVALLVVGAWLHCNFIGLAFLLIALLLCTLRRSSHSLRLIFLLQLSVLILIILQYISTFTRLHFEGADAELRSDMWDLYGANVEDVDNGILAFDEAIILAMVMWYNYERNQKYRRKRILHMISRSDTQVEEDRISEWHFHSERLLSSKMSVAGMSRFLNLWGDVYSVGGSDTNDFMSSFLSPRRDYVSGKVFMYIFLMLYFSLSHTHTHTRTHNVGTTWKRFSNTYSSLAYPSS